MLEQLGLRPRTKRWGRDGCGWAPDNSREPSGVARVRHAAFPIQKAIFIQVAAYALEMRGAPTSAWQAISGRRQNQ